jgi:uncharacterized alkaline shock family protein YloU
LVDAEMGMVMKVDTKEFELPETVFIRDIDTKVFQSIILQCLCKIEGISLLDGNFIDSLLGRDGVVGVKGIYVEQNPRNHAVSAKVEVNIRYGIPIPDKAEEIQLLIASEITRLTGLHVDSVHVVFKNLIVGEGLQHSKEQPLFGLPAISSTAQHENKEYTDDF